LAHTNKWHRQQALRLLADRRDGAVVDKLKRLAAQPDNPHALDALWALHASGGFTGEIAINLMLHPQAEVRGWTARLIGDLLGRSSAGLRPAVTHERQELSASLLNALRVLARRDTNPQIRSQLASTAKRLPGERALPLVFELCTRAEDDADPHIPLLLWWSLEDKAISNRREVARAFEQPKLWSQPLVRRHMLHRLARRYATLPTPENQEILAALLRSAPDADTRKRLLDGINEAFKGRGAEGLISSLGQALDQPGASGKRDPSQLALALRRGDPRAVSEALGFIAQEDAKNETARVQVIAALGESDRKEATSVLLELLAGSRNGTVRQAAVEALGHFDSPELADDILSRWSSLDSPLRRSALSVLCSRKAWAGRLLSAVGGAGVISKQDVPDEMVNRIRLLRDAEISAMCDRYFGKVSVATTEEKQKRIVDVAAILKAGPGGDTRAGQTLFAARCAACHELFGEGGKAGPELTGYERTNLETMLLNIVDPNVAIREGYTLFQIATKDGRELAGFIIERDGSRITLRDLSGALTVVPLDRVQTEQAVPTSIMPEGLLDDLAPRQIRDLFAYLTSPSLPRP
ncbi:MAG: HEAT repeat domain-containing protein, partial [Verrucomicrobia bacterium]|nr:HEAT repeat domain-containing protein [Verrucomicrobiota bacterium]